MFELPSHENDSFYVVKNPRIRFCMRKLFDHKILLCKYGTERLFRTIFVIKRRALNCVAIQFHNFIGSLYLTGKLNQNVEITKTFCKIQFYLLYNRIITLLPKTRTLLPTYILLTALSSWLKLSLKPPTH